jgi:hypothetical protein
MLCLCHIQSYLSTVQANSNIKAIEEIKMTEITIQSVMNFVVELYSLKKATILDSNAVITENHTSTILLFIYLFLDNFGLILLF